MSLKVTPVFAQFSRRELEGLLDIQNRCITCGSDRESFVEILELTQNLVPFEHAAVSFNVNQPGIAHTSPTTSFGFEWEWLDRCGQTPGLVETSSEVYKKQQGAPWYWSDRKINPFADAALDYGHDYGYRCGIAVGIGFEHQRSPSTTLIVGAYNNNFAGHELKLLELLMPHFHEVLRRDGEFRDFSRALPSLTPAELEVLKWCKEGKTSWEIGEITRRSERTVRFHLANLFRKLNVTSRAHAVAKALTSGLLDPD